MGHCPSSERPETAFLPAGAAGRLRSTARVPAAGLEDMAEGRLGIVARDLALDDLQSTGRADVEAGAQPVAIDVLDQHRLVLPVDPECALHAGRRAKAAAVAGRPVDFYDLALSHLALLAKVP